MFLETSEDLYIRAFDTRKKPFKPAVEFKVDTNFATTMDICSEDRYLATGHRGFDGAGCAVKLWDLRKVMAITASDNVTSEQLTEFEYSGHKFTPESVRFVKSLETTSNPSSSGVNIISASKDATLQAIGSDGQSRSTERNSDGFACMDVLAKCPFGANNNVDQSRIVVTADIKQRLQVYLYDESTSILRHHPLNYD